MTRTELKQKINQGWSTKDYKTIVNLFDAYDVLTDDSLSCFFHELELKGTGRGFDTWTACDMLPGGRKTEYISEAIYNKYAPRLDRLAQRTGAKHPAQFLTFFKVYTETETRYSVTFEIGRFLYTKYADNIAAYEEQTREDFI